MLGEFYAPRVDCRRYVRSRTAAQVFAAMKPRVKEILATRERDRIARLNAAAKQRAQDNNDQPLGGGGGAANKTKKKMAVQLGEEELEAKFDRMFESPTKASGASKQQQEPEESAEAPQQ